MKDVIKQLGELALATRLKRLSDRLIQDVSKIYHERGFDFDPRWFALMQVLKQRESISVMDAAAVLKITHPAVVQLADQLEKKNIISTSKDKKDGRKRNMELTAKGKKLLSDLAPLLKNIKLANKKYLNSTGYDILSMIEKLEKAIEEKSMYQRVMEQINGEELPEIEILKYHARYKKDFKALNYEWLKKYFTIEALDIQILSHPEKTILNKGGGIFFARDAGKIVGTCAIVKTGRATFELTKMAVTQDHQGKQIGKKLGFAAIDFCKNKNAKEITLETSMKLITALALYQKLGFAIEKRNTPSKYERGTVFMRLKLK